jgi:hypothetical protein
MPRATEVKQIPARIHEQDITTPLSKEAEDAIAYGMAPPITRCLREALADMASATPGTQAVDNAGNTDGIYDAAHK